MTRFIFAISNCSESEEANNYANARLYYFYNQESLLKKFEEDGFAQSITFMGFISNIPVEENNTLEYDVFKPTRTRGSRYVSCPHDMFSERKYSDAFFCYAILSWCLTVGEYTSNYNTYKTDKLIKSLFEFYHFINKDGLLIYYDNKTTNDWLQLVKSNFDPN